MLDSKTIPAVVPLHVTILPWQRERLGQLMRERGLIGPSETLRYVLTMFFNSQPDLYPPPPAEQKTTTPENVERQMQGVQAAIGMFQKHFGETA